MWAYAGTYRKWGYKSYKSLLPCFGKAKPSIDVGYSLSVTYFVPISFR